MGGHGSKPVWDDKVPDMRGKTALITGANSGLGLETARRLAASGATVVLACRNEQRGAAAVEELKRAQPDASVSFLQLDLCSQKSVKQAAASFKKAHKNLHLLINNAAVMATPYKLTEDGFEEQIAATHLGHFTLTAELIDRLKASQPSRIVTQSSMMHNFSGDLPLTAEGLNAKRWAWSIYANAKLANMLFTLELQKRLENKGLAPGIIAVACHPGYTATNLQNTPGYGPRWLSSGMNAMFAQKVEVGAQPQLYAAVGADIQNGDYTGPLGNASGPACKVPRAERAKDQQAAAKLWALTAQLTKTNFLN